MQYSQWSHTLARLYPQELTFLSDHVAFIFLFVRLRVFSIYFKHSDFVLICFCEMSKGI